MNKKILSAAATLSGTIIGAGILGLPYVFSRSGFLIGWFWVIFFGLIVLLTFLYLSEICLRTKEDHQLPGLAETYLGQKGKYLMLSAMIFGIYASLIAYLIGEGESISLLLFGTIDYGLYMTLLFWILLTVLLEGGLERLKEVETYGLLAVAIIVIGTFFYYLKDMSLNNLTYIAPQHFFIPLGVTLFALLGFTSIPEIRDEMRGSEKQLKKAILIGTLIPIILYILFSATFIGVLGQNISEIATLSFGPFIVILGIFTMLTSYFAISFSLKDVYQFDLKLTKRKSFIFTSLLPLILFIITYLLKWDNFIAIIGIGGVISGGIVGSLILIMNYIAKIEGKRKPEYSIPINIMTIATLILIFTLGVILQIYYTL